MRGSQLPRMKRLGFTLLGAIFALALAFSGLTGGLTTARADTAKCAVFVATVKLPGLTGGDLLDEFNKCGVGVGETP